MKKYKDSDKAHVKSKEDYILKGRWEVIDGGINLEHHRFEEITTLRFENNGDLTVIAATKRKRSRDSEGD